MSSSSEDKKVKEPDSEESLSGDSFDEHDAAVARSSESDSQDEIDGHDGRSDDSQSEDSLETKDKKRHKRDERHRRNRKRFQDHKNRFVQSEKSWKDKSAASVDSRRRHHGHHSRDGHSHHRGDHSRDSHSHAHHRGHHSRDSHHRGHHSRDSHDTGSHSHHRHHSRDSHDRGHHSRDSHDSGSHSHRSHDSDSHDRHRHHSSKSRDIDVLPYDPNDESSDHENYDQIDLQTLHSALPPSEHPEDCCGPLENFEIGSKKWIKEQKKLIKFLDMEAESMVWKCDFNKHQVKHVIYDIWEVALGYCDAATRKQFIQGCRKLHLKIAPCAYSLLFDLFDDNHSARITRREFVLEMSEIMTTEEGLYNHICKMVDHRKDGVIDKIEFVFAIGRLVTKTLILSIGAKHRSLACQEEDLFHSVAHSAQHTLELVEHLEEENDMHPEEAELRRASSNKQLLKPHQDLFTDLVEVDDSALLQASSSTDNLHSSKAQRRHGSSHSHSHTHASQKSMSHSAKPSRKHASRSHRKTDDSSSYSEALWDAAENDALISRCVDIDHTGIETRLCDLFDIADTKSRGFITYSTLKKMLKAAEFANEIKVVRKTLEKIYYIRGTQDSIDSELIVH